MTIKDVEKKLNISRANIRFYEKEGLLEPKRNENEYRNYSENDISKLEKILLFRKCNISIENIRLIFNNEKSIEDVFKEQITVIENEVKQLEGAKIMCQKLSQEKSSVDDIDAEKYINIMNIEEQKGNKFYNIAEDYIFANEKLYQSIIENKEFKGGLNMKKGIKIGIYIANFVLTVLIFALFDLIIQKSIDWENAIIFTAILTSVNLIGVKKYIENKSGKKFTKKDNINHFIIIIIIMVVCLTSYLTIKSIYEVNQDPKEAILEMSVKKSLISIAEEKYQSNENNIYAESHKILSYEIINDNLYVYVMAYYGVLSKDTCEVVNNTKNTLTMVYTKNKNKEGIYELKDYKEDFIPSKLKDKSVNYDDEDFKSQLNNYCSK